MTTIAYRDGVMSSDSSISFGSTIMFLNAPKIIKVVTPNHIHLAGCAGGSANCALFRQWVLDGMNGYPPKGEESDTGLSGIVVSLDRFTWKIEQWLFEKDASYQVKEEFICVGSGADFALGAMFMGGDTVHAIRAAKRFDAYSNGPIRTVRFGHLGILSALKAPKDAKKPKNDNSELEDDPYFGRQWDV